MWRIVYALYVAPRIAQRLLFRLCKTSLATKVVALWVWSSALVHDVFEIEGMGDCF